ncbi:MAG: hypothetical protein JJD98_00405 [Polaromonas sp.]|nr:hypothetical protein [Polaromonas sp.]
MNTCSTCTSWGLKNSPLARNGLAPCVMECKRFQYLPPQGACDRHKPIDQAAADARVLWLGRIDQKHKQGVTA